VWGEYGVLIMEDYEKQSQEFLSATNSTLTVKLSDKQTAPLWAKNEKHGYKYDIELVNARGSYKFSFWDSIANAGYIDALNFIKNSQLGENRTNEYYKAQDLLKSKNALGLKSGLSMMRARTKYNEYIDELKPSAYSVLACLSVDYSDDFADFCSMYGYDTDSITAKKTYEAVIEQDRQLRRMFTLEELDMLQQVQ
jgi:hypothetical protein